MAPTKKNTFLNWLEELSLVSSMTISFIEKNMSIELSDNIANFAVIVFKLKLAIGELWPDVSTPVPRDTDKPTCPNLKDNNRVVRTGPKVETSEMEAAAWVWDC